MDNGYSLKITKHNASERLSPYIRNFVVAESGSQVDYCLLPGTSLMISVRLKGQSFNRTKNVRSQLPVSVISGLRNAPRSVDYAKDTSSFLIIFREAACSLFFDEPLFEFFGNSVPLEALVSHLELQVFEEQLAHANNDNARIMIAEQFLLSRLKSRRPDDRISKAAEFIRLNQGNIRIADLAANLKISQDTLEKKFSQLVGATPKQFARIVRFQSLIKTHASGQELTEAAYQVGYFDQSHFIREFKAFTGMTPARFPFGSKNWS
jgi:AraC-like DNA-binding protein